MKNKYLVSIIISILLMFAVVLPAFAHPGSTDEYGGHVDWSTGEYHYHHGYPAHSHTGGVCPYNFVDNADHSNHGSGSTIDYDYQYGDREQYTPDEQYELITPLTTPEPEDFQKQSDSKTKKSAVEIIIISIAILFGFPFVAIVLWKLSIKISDYIFITFLHREPSGWVKWFLFTPILIALLYLFVKLY